MGCLGFFVWWWDGIEFSRSEMIEIYIGIFFFYFMVGDKVEFSKRGNNWDIDWDMD